jgi:transcriptional regulator with XRE-family HTH domain
MTQRRHLHGIPVPQLRVWRFTKLLTQRELAEQAGVQQRTISRAEVGGNASFATIKKLAIALEISAEQLLNVDTNADT